MRVVILGSVRANGDSWHNAVAAEAEALGWDCIYTRVYNASPKSIVEQARGADMLVWCYAHGHEPRGDGHGMLRRIEDAGTVTVGLHQDLYWNLPRQHRIGKMPWWTCQYVYTADGGERDWRSRGVQNHIWCPPALGIETLGRTAAKGKYRYIFAGGYVRSIHGDHRAKLVTWARRKWPRDFHWYGTTTQSRIYGDTLGGVVAHAWVTLGDSAPAAYYWSDRVVRMLGRGAVFAHPRVEGMKEQGFSDETMIHFDRYDFKTLSACIDSMTSKDRADMREAAITVVRERHLWRHRLVEFATRAGLL